MLDIYDELGTHEGFTMIQLSSSGLYNFLTPNKRLLSEESFVDAGPFKEGFAAVQRLDKKWYFLKSDVTFIPECNSFFRAYCFHEGFANK